MSAALLALALSALPQASAAGAPSAFPGLTLISPMTSTSVLLVDSAGEIVHEWPTDHPPGNSVYLQDDGSILRCCRLTNERFRGGGRGGLVQEHSWDGKLTWEYRLCDERAMQHHDIEPLPNGNVLLIAWEYMSSEEAIAAGRDPRLVHAAGLWPDFVVEVKPTRPQGGTVVWEWHAKDHLLQDVDEAKPNFGDVAAHPERIDVNAGGNREPRLSPEEEAERAERERKMRALGYAGDGPAPTRHELSDWLHTNSIDYHAGHDLILLSVRAMSEIWVIDHGTTSTEARGSSGGRRGRGGDLLYRWGNPANYRSSGAEARKLFAQHDATWVDDGADLRVLVFNNGDARADGSWSSVDEIVLPFDPERGFLREPGTPFGPAQLAWTWHTEPRESFFCWFLSGVQRLPNGNTLICDGPQGRLIEVTSDGTIVWEWQSTYGGDVPLGGPPGPGGGPPRGGPGGPPKADRTGLFRATRIPFDHPGLLRLRER